MSAVVPTCTEEGNNAYWICIDCGKLFIDAEETEEIDWDDVILPPKGHSADTVWTYGETMTEPTCTTSGYARLELYCSECGELLSTRGMLIPAYGHKWLAWEMTKTPTEEEEGEETRTCENDPTHVETRLIPAVGHTHTLKYIEANKVSCTEGGNIAYWICSGCGLHFRDESGKNWVSEEDTIIPPLGHNTGEWSDGEIVKQPACETPGAKRLELRCTRCRELLATRGEIPPALGHDWGEPEYLWSDDYSIVIAERLCKRDFTHVEQEISDEIEIYELDPATCEEEGEDLYIAEFENEAFFDWENEATEPTGHDWGEWQVTKAATEDEEGEQEQICRNDPEHVRTTTIPQLKHIHCLTRVEATDPTCTQEGNRTYWICDGGDYPCEKIFNDPDGKKEVLAEDYSTLILDPLGHDWKRKGEVVWTDDHYSAVFTYICQRDESHTREILAEALGEPKLTPPTSTADGRLTYIVAAEFDGKTYTETWLEPVHRARYRYTEKTDAWIKDSGKTADFRIVRGNGSNTLDNDALTFEIFTGIRVDGQTVAAAQYTVKKGSVILSLKSAYLETISVGPHYLTADFEDGSVTTQFQVLPKGTKITDDGQYIYTQDGRTYSYSPKTGDNSRIVLWGVLAGLSGFGVVGCALKVQKKRRLRPGEQK